VSYLFSGQKSYYRGCGVNKAAAQPRWRAVAGGLKRSDFAPESASAFGSRSRSMIERTHKKLREARSFFGHLSHETRQFSQNESEVFDWYLSAFLSAARSVTFVLQVEDKKHYDAWYPNWKNNLNNEDRALWEKMNEWRG
jgi:hypothetical protein